MSADEPKTAADLLASLHADEKWVTEEEQRAALHQQSVEAFAADHQRATSLLGTALGLEVDDVAELHAHDGPELVASVLTVAEAMNDAEDVLVSLVGLLRSEWAVPSAFSLLLELCDASRSERTRWAAADVLADIANDTIAPELISKALDTSLGQSRQMLTVALGRVPSEQAAAALGLLLRDPTTEGHAILAIGEGRLDQLRADVAGRVDHPQEWIRDAARETLRLLC